MCASVRVSYPKAIKQLVFLCFETSRVENYYASGRGIFITQTDVFNNLLVTLVYISKRYFL